MEGAKEGDKYGSIVPLKVLELLLAEGDEAVAYSFWWELLSCSMLFSTNIDSTCILALAFEVIPTTLSKLKRCPYWELSGSELGGAGF